MKPSGADRPEEDGSGNRSATAFLAAFVLAFLGLLLLGILACGGPPPS